MMHVMETSPDVFTPITGDIVVGEGDDAVIHPRAILGAWSAAELAEIGVYNVADAARTALVQVTAIRYERAGDDIVQVLTVSAPTKPELTAYLADLRWQKEEAGTVWNGWPVATDRVSQQKVLAEFVAVSGGLRTNGNEWKFADGIFRAVSNVDFPALVLTVRAHVESAFAVEAIGIEGIVAGTITTAAEIDALNWPISSEATA